MRFLTIVLNIIFLFSFGAGQASCMCSENDECQGLANPLLQKKLTQIHAEFEKRNLLSELTEDQSASSASISISVCKDDCCADCFNTPELVTNGTVDTDENLFDATPKPTFYTAELKDRKPVSIISPRAPPETQAGTKTYLAKRTLLI